VHPPTPQLGRPCAVPRWWKAWYTSLVGLGFHGELQLLGACCENRHFSRFYTGIALVTAVFFLLAIQKIRARNRSFGRTCLALASSSPNCVTPR
jgi:hypothetical protein